MGSARPSGAVHGLRGRPRRREPGGRDSRGARGPAADLVLCERAEGLVARQRERLPTARQVALADLAPITGAIVANEVHDACPAHVLRWPDELRVGVDGNGHFAWVVAGAAPETLRRIVERSVAAPPPGLELAVSPAQAELQGLLAERVARARCSCSTTARTARAVPAAGAAPAHVPRRAPGRRSAGRAGSPGHHLRRRLRGVRAAGEAAGLRTVLDERQAAWLRQHGALERVGRAGRAARSGSGSSRSPGTRHRARASGCSCRSVRRRVSRRARAPRPPSARPGRDRRRGRP